MAETVHSDQFIEICYECEFDPKQIRDKLVSLYPNYTVWPNQIQQRIANYRRKGLLPLESGNSISTGEILKGSSTLFDEDGNIKLQWLKTDVPKEQFLEAFENAISQLATRLPAQPTVTPPTIDLHEATTLYISNDVHVGALIWDKETGEDYDTDIASQRLHNAYDYLFETSPNSRVGIVVDLGEYRRLS